MTFTVQGTIAVNGTQAKAELKAVGAELKKVGTDGTGMARGTKEAAAGTKVLEAGAAAAEADLLALAAAERQAAQDAVLVGRSHTIGAGGVANLTAQFNDIGVMLAAGQNPLQLAIQQGTQITQVFGNMGAGAAVRGLGQALLSMLSPLNLITIASIAGGAALFQWLTASEEVETLDDAISGLSDSIDQYVKINGQARSSTADLKAEFGSAAVEARGLLLELSGLARVEAERASKGSAAGLRSQVTENSWLTATFTDQGTTAAFFDLDTNIKGTWAEVNKLLAAFDKVENAVTLRDQIEAYKELNAQIRLVADRNGERSAQESDAITGLIQQELELLRLRAEQNRASENNGRFAGPEAAQAGLDYLMQQQIAIRDVVAAEQERLAVQTAQRAEQALIALFGRDSEIVAQNRLAAERELFAAALETAGATDDKARAELDAWDAATGFNAEAAGMPGLMAATASAAAGIAGGIWNAVTAMAALKASDRRTFLQGDDERGSQREGRADVLAFRSQQARQLASRRAAQYQSGFLKEQLGTGGTGRKGGGARAAREETDAVAELIAKLKDEIALEREMDPIKREMIKHREVLKDATAAEREEVERLIVQREREKAATESLNWIGEQAGDTLIDALMGGADAGERLIEVLKRAVLQALLLGQGPLAGLLGGLGGGGGLLGLLGIGGGGQVLAEGGIVYGEGGPTDDKVHARLSPGEFVVNARATRRHRSLLQSLNTAPAFADGGLVDDEDAPAEDKVSARLLPTASILSALPGGRRRSLVDRLIAAEAEPAPGMIYGIGGPTDDKVSARLSPGEFVVNARATRRHGRLLERLNEAPGFAAGGLVGGGSGGSSGGNGASGQAAGTFVANFDLRGAQGEASIRKAAMEGMQAAIAEYRRTGLPGDIRRANENPRVLRF